MTAPDAPDPLFYRELVEASGVDPLAPHPHPSAPLAVPGEDVTDPEFAWFPPEEHGRHEREVA